MREVTFYATAAQVIPVLALALLFERRLFEPRGEERRDHSLHLLSVLMLLTGGEFVALFGVLGADSGVAKAVVIAAVTWGMMGLFGPAFLSRFSALRRQLPTWALWTARLAWLPVLLAFIAAALITDRADVLFPAGVLVLWVCTTTVSFILSERERASRLLGERNNKGGEGTGASPERVPNRVPNGADSAVTERN